MARPWYLSAASKLQHQSVVSIQVITAPAAAFGKSDFGIKRTGRSIRCRHLQEHAHGPCPLCPLHCRHKQALPDAGPPHDGHGGEGQDFRFIRRLAHQHEATCRVDQSVHAGRREQRCKRTGAPSLGSGKGCRVNGGAGGGMGWAGDNQTGAGRKAVEGRASGGST